MGAEQRVGLLPHQARMLQSIARIVVVTSGLGGGKTFGLGAWGLQHAYVNADSPNKVALYEPTFPMVKSILVPTLEELCELFGFNCRWVPSNRIFKAKVNRRWVELLLGGASIPDHMKGPNLAGVGIDEVAQLKNETLMHALKRPRGKGVAHIQSMLVGTPDHMHNLFYNHAEGVGETYKRRLESGYTERIKACTLDNPELDEDYIREELSEFSPEEARRYIWGEFTPNRGRVYPHMKMPEPKEREGGNVRILPDWVKRARHEQIIIGCDFNISPMVFLIGLQRDTPEGPIVHWFREVITNNAQTFEVGDQIRQDLASELSKRYHDVSPAEAAKRCKVYPDASGQYGTTASRQSDVDHLRALGFQVMVRPQNPAIEDRVSTVNYWLRKDRMFFDPACARTIEALNAQGRDKKTGQPDKTTGLDHYADAVGYAAFGVFPKPRPLGNVKRYRYR